MQYYYKLLMLNVHCSTSPIAEEINHFESHIIVYGLNKISTVAGIDQKLYKLKPQKYEEFQRFLRAT